MSAQGGSGFATYTALLGDLGLIDAVLARLPLDSPDRGRALAAVARTRAKIDRAWFSAKRAAARPLGGPATTQGRPTS